MTLEVPEVRSLPAGIYDAKVTNLEVKTTDAGTFRIWSFDVGGEKVTASSSMMFGPKSKTYKWVSALIGRTPVPGEKLEVIGLPCQLHLIVDDDSGYNKVDTVLPAARATQAATAASTQPVTPYHRADQQDLGSAPVAREMPPLSPPPTDADYRPPMDVDDIPF